MMQDHPTRTVHHTRRARRRRGVGPRLAVIAFLGVAGFAAGFVLLWAAGSWLVGGPGWLWKSDEPAMASRVELSVQSDYKIEPLIDLLALRDLSYVPVKGVYVSSYAAGSSDFMTAMLGLAERTEINAFVVDVKEDLGYVTYSADVALAKELGLIERRIRDIDAFIATLSEHNIIPIARVVCFKDSILAEKRPDLAVMHKDGSVWKDRKGLNYTNPYNHEVWEYIVQVSEDAARRGFREIQFDYVRFPSDGPISQAVYPGEYCSKADAIAGFLAYARERLEKLGVWVSADVFGLTVHVKDDMGIGQQIEKVARNVDIVCPMVYPSHYDAGSYGVEHPNASPYEIIKAAMKDTTNRLAGTGAMGRPWLQDFSLGGVEYGVERVKAQIKAAEEQGYTEWILWDPNVKYTEGALRKSGG